MQFSEIQIQEFIEIYKSHFGEKLDRRVAFEYSEKLYRMIELTYQQISVSDLKALQERRKHINQSKP